MKKTFFNLLLVAILSVMVIPTAFAGIPMSDKSDATVVTATENVIIEEANEIQKPAKKAKTAKKSKRSNAMAGKSQLVALLLCFFLGWIGVHRFYLGYTWQGIVQLLFGWNILGIWVLIDFIRIIIGSLTPKDGAYDSTL